MENRYKYWEELLTEISKMEKEYKHWRVEVKEKYSDAILKPELHRNYDYNDVISFFGLKEPDIEWYKITEI